MSMSYWMVQGLGVKLDEISSLLDAEKIRLYLLNSEKCYKDFNDQKLFEKYLVSDNKEKLNILIEIIECEDKLNSIIAESDEKGLISYDDNGDGEYYIFYPLSYPWNLSENECKTEEAAKQHICNVLMKFMLDDMKIDILSCIDYISEVGFG